MVYQYYQQSESDPQAQIDALKKSIELSRAKSLGIPPGLHAHLGMLYGATGALDLAMAEFNEEKSLYPESAEFMDRLMKNKGMQNESFIHVNLFCICVGINGLCSTCQNRLHRI